MPSYILTEDNIDEVARQTGCTPEALAELYYNNSKKAVIVIDCDHPPAQA